MHQTRRPPAAGPLALVGGAEFLPGNEPYDELLVAAAERLGHERPAYVVATAAVRQDPDRAVATAVGWYAALGLAVEELALRTRTDANARSTAERAARGRFFAFTGGDPGLVISLLERTRALHAMVQAWRAGAVLAGSSAGAMAFGEWTLIRARVPGDSQRRPRAAFGLVPGVAVLPHFDTFGRRWIASARQLVDEAAGSRPWRLVGIDEKTAAVWRDGTWLAQGSGGVTVIEGGRERRFAAGATIESLPTPLLE